MTIEKAISWLKCAVPIKALTMDEFSDFITAVNMAIEAMEKQIPSGIRFNGDEEVCPKCGADAEWKKYCEECGQRLVSDDEG